jgi:hypothetical protein
MVFYALKNYSSNFKRLLVWREGRSADAVWLTSTVPNPTSPTE